VSVPDSLPYISSNFKASQHFGLDATWYTVSVLTGDLFSISSYVSWAKPGVLPLGLNATRRPWLHSERRTDQLACLSNLRLGEDCATVEYAFVSCLSSMNLNCHRACVMQIINIVWFREMNSVVRVIGSPVRKGVKFTCTLLGIITCSSMKTTPICLLFRSVGLNTENKL